MRTKKQDNRLTRRTQAAIQAAVLKALGQKPIESITVQELLDEANICRATFYSYYYDIYDLVETIETGIIDEVGQALEQLRDIPIKVDGGFPTITSVVRIYAKHADTIRLLNGPNVHGDFDTRIQHRIYKVTRELRARKEGERFDEKRHLLYSCYVISGGISVINRLLADGEPWDPERMGRILGKMADAGELVFLDEMAERVTEAKA